MQALDQARLIRAGEMPHAAAVDPFPGRPSREQENSESWEECHFVSLENPLCQGT